MYYVLLARFEVCGLSLQFLLLMALHHPQYFLLEFSLSAKKFSSDICIEKIVPYLHKCNEMDSKHPIEGRGSQNDHLTSVCCGFHSLANEIHIPRRVNDNRGTKSVSQPRDLLNEIKLRRCCVNYVGCAKFLSQLQPSWIEINANNSFGVL